MSTPSPGEMRRYLTEVRAHPLLSVEQERRLARRNRRGDRQARERLAVSNLRFVVKIARQYRAFGLPLADLVQEGNVGLLIALRHFNPGRGVRLTTYAVWWIRALIQSYIVANWSLVKLGTTQAQRKLFFRLPRVRSRLEQLGGGQPASAEAVAAQLSVKPREVQEMDVRMLGEVSLDAPVGRDPQRPLVEVTPSTAAGPEEIAAEREEREWRAGRVEAALRQLSPRQRFIVERRWLTDEPPTRGELGARLRLSRERIRQIEGDGLRALRTALSRSRPGGGPHMPRRRRLP